MTEPQPTRVGPLAGLRVVELAQWVFVPSAGALLSDLGADVVRIEHPETGDPYRGITTGGSDNSDHGRLARQWQVNRGKRSVGIDVKTAEGQTLLQRMIEGADVFLTSLRAQALARLGASPEDLLERNPRLIYARGDAYGANGPDAAEPGFDITAFWARGGIGDLLTEPGAESLARQPAGFGDRIGGLSLAAGVLAGLQQRERTGAGGHVTASLMDAAAWVSASDVVARVETERIKGGFAPLVGSYRCADDRWIMISLLQGQQHWAPLCAVLDDPALATDERFVTDAARAAHPGELRKELEVRFVARSLNGWRERFEGFEGAWAPVQTTAELAHDRQVEANRMLLAVPVEDGSGAEVRLVRGPFAVDGGPTVLHRGPELGEHTESVLLEHGLDWPEIIGLKIAGVIL